MLNFYIKGKKNLHDLARDRTWNLLLRRQAPYPLGHKATNKYLSLSVKIDGEYQRLVCTDSLVTF